MVQRKMPSKLRIQADHVKSEKRLANQDGKNRGADMKKKMKKSRPIKIYLSDLDALQSSSPSRKYLSQPGKPPPLHVPTTAASASPQKQQPLLRTMDGSPNYMKPTSSSHAKKELFPVSLRNTQSGSNFKNLTGKFSSDSKASCVSSKISAKALTRSSSLSLVRSLTKTPSFKASRACPRKSARAVLCADMSAPQRATCSSALKHSKFPAYLMLNPGGTESEGTSVMKVCPYAYCSLNGHGHGHGHAALPPLKSFLSARRRLLKTQKSMRLDALSPRRVKVPCDTKKDSEVEQTAFDANATYDEIGVDISIEIYAKERETKPTGAYQMGKFDFVKEIEESGPAAREDGVKQVAPSLMDAPSTPESEVDLEDDYKKSFDDVSVQVDAKGIFLHEQSAEESDERNHPTWSHEELRVGSYCSDDSYDGEHMKDVEMADSDSKGTDMEWEGQLRLCGFGHEEDVDSSVSFEEDTDSKEISHDVSITWLDDILSSYYVDVLAEETIKESNAEERSFSEEHGNSSVLEGTSGSTEIEETGCPSNDLGCDQSFSAEVSFEYPIKAVDNGKENEKHLDDEETIDNNQCQKMREIYSVGETSGETSSNLSLENSDESSNKENQVHMFDVPEDSTIAVKEKALLEKYNGKAKKFENTGCLIREEEQNASKNWNSAIRRRRPVEDVDEMRKFNPKEPNFLPLVPVTQPEKVDLRRQMMEERKDSEQWMLDCALRQVVTKLAPARKRKVALLVEAFETIMPIPKSETRMRNHAAFPHARHVQACS